MPDYTPSDVDTLLAKMAEERAALLAAAEGLSPADANRVPIDAQGEAQWTAKEQLAHLWEMERGYVAICRAALRQSGATASLEPAAVPIPLEAAPRHTVAEFIAGLKQERERTVAFIRGLTLGQFARTARTDAFGELTVMQWLRSYYRHDRQHAAQIQGRRSDYVPHFAAGTEPNQRRLRLERAARRGAASSPPP